jgi:molecular chaperone DnaK
VAPSSFCLATGGMVSMPAIQEGLREIFGMNGLHLIENAATVISEGAAWIAYDRVGLRLAKSIELLHADNSYIPLIPTGTDLPLDGKAIQHRIDMYGVDPTDGFAKFLFARPTWPGHESHGDARLPYTHLTLPVDSHSRPLFERLHIEVKIDPDLIAEVQARSPMCGQSRQARIHDLEFGLRVIGSCSRGADTLHGCSSRISCRVMGRRSERGDLGSNTVSTAL